MLPSFWEVQGLFLFAYWPYFTPHPPRIFPIFSTFVAESEQEEASPISCEYPSEIKIVSMIHLCLSLNILLFFIGIIVLSWGIERVKMRPWWEFSWIQNDFPFSWITPSQPLLFPYNPISFPSIFPFFSLIILVFFTLLITKRTKLLCLYLLKIFRLLLTIGRVMGEKGESAEKIKGKISPSLFLYFSSNIPLFFPSYSYNLYEGIFAFWTGTNENKMRENEILEKVREKLGNEKWWEMRGFIEGEYLFLPFWGYLTLPYNNTPGWMRSRGCLSLCTFFRGRVKTSTIPWQSREVVCFR